MPERRDLRLDLAACAWLLAGCAVAACLFRYDPADGPGGSVYPAPEPAHNWLGPPGAWLARLLLQTFGVAGYILIGAWFVLAATIFLRSRVRQWSGRLAGWLLLVPLTALLADQSAERFNLRILHGGGLLGAWLARFLDANLAGNLRIYVVSGSVAVALVLALGELLVYPLRAVVFVIRPGTRAARKKAAHVPPPVETHGLPPVALEPAPVSLEAPPLGLGDELPPLTLLEDPQPFPYEKHEQRLRELSALLEKTFTDFALNVKVVGINTGPVVTQFEIALETGLRVQKVTRLADDLALNLKVPSVRIVAPIPGKNTVGIEVPNAIRATVCLKEVIRGYGDKLAKAKIPLFLGQDTEGKPLVHDLAEMPHLLIAGRTGTGKSVCMNAIILSILMTRRPDEVKMIMIDPKMLEMSEYGKIPHLMHPVVKDMKKAEAILSWAVDKMEERYDILSRARVRGIAGYNELSPAEIHRRLGVAELSDDERQRIPDRMPYIVIFVDEMNDLMMTMKKEVEGHIIRLAQKSRAAGIHLVVATQKPTVDVITGLIKSNLPARICFQVSSRSDSRVVLDEMGADKLLGKGDMLFLVPGTSTIVRAQGTYASDGEIARVVGHLECEPCYAQELVQIGAGGGKEKGGSMMDRLRARDELYEQAIEVIVREGRGSVSLLQRALGIGYGRAARLVDFMAEDGIVGDYNGSQAREVLYTPEQWAALKEPAGEKDPRAAARGLGIPA
jgi:S-DNA-T family DNA segregation ATPase FtsK/SpoIIIE